MVANNTKIHAHVGTSNVGLNWATTTKDLIEVKRDQENRERERKREKECNTIIISRGQVHEQTVLLGANFIKLYDLS